MELLFIVPVYVLFVNRLVGLLASSCLSVGMAQFGSHWTDFHEILYLTTFENQSRSLKFN
jgi:hypothetical protein